MIQCLRNCRGERLRRSSRTEMIRLCLLLIPAVLVGTSSCIECSPTPRSPARKPSTTSGATHDDGSTGDRVRTPRARADSSPRARADSPRPPIRAEFGALSEKAVRSVLRLHLGAIRECYLRHGRRSGTVVLRLGIAPSGKVLKAEVFHSSLLGSVEPCIVRSARHWVFPRPFGGKPTAIVFPLYFRPPGQG